ncbi:hypothetical protein [Hymenobacter sp. CRA2]|uniref:hypothetical protein n=1 Tax=Hymenobacter sp. CRA2 TaxID=1955620 RepID=UPI00098ED758|nr:hypothetical protein [Hymenobacter sp. CRA2]OON70768.1 hypothetical protein B0919_01785 [Hymenobacter sp. CRA2]
MPSLASSDDFLFYALTGLCLLLAAGLTWQAWRGATGGRAVLRMVAGLLAAAALWLTAYPPQHRIAGSSSAAAVLLTEGYRPDTLRVLLRRLGPVPVLYYRPAHALRGDTLPLASLRALATHYPAVRQLHVMGLGLPVADLAALPPQVQLQPYVATRSAFMAATWQQQLALGQTLQVDGTVAASGSGATWVRLVAEGGNRDSVHLPQGSGHFTLRYTPRRAGQLLAQLVARRNGNVVATEPVPTQVRAARQLRVLLLAGSPSFELNLLKNHLAERGHHVALRLQVSRGLTQTDAQNLTGTDPTRLSPALLRSFDVAITDADGLSSLSGEEARQLTSATAEGLGVVLTGAAELPRTLPGRTDFALQARPVAQAERPQALHWTDGQGTALYTAVLRPSPRQRVLLTGATASTIVGAARRTGWGSTVVATPTNTFQWLLSGAVATYDTYWRQLLLAAARPLEPAAQWQRPAWPRAHEPLVLTLAATAPPARSARLETSAAAATSLAFYQHPAQPGTWLADAQPTQAGWHTAVAPGQDTAAFYVFKAADWRGVLAAQRLAAARQHVSKASAAVSPARTLEAPWLAAGWYFALFLVAAGWLWLDEKR